MAIGATAIWRVRPSGVNTNGGGYDPGISGAATDYSQQNAAQATGSNATCATGTATFVDATANAFTAAMVGNAIQIASGTNFTPGFYFVIGFTSASTVTLDRSPVGATSGTVGVWNLGGGWADWVTNIPSMVSGNVLNVLGTHTPNPASYTYDYVISTGVSISTAITIQVDPATPGYLSPPQTGGGMPVSQITLATGRVITVNGGGLAFNGMWCVAGTGIGANTPVLFPQFAAVNVFGCVFDQFGLDATFLLLDNNNGYQNGLVLGSEFFSSVTPGSAGTHAAILTSSNGGSSLISGCNIHDCVGIGILNAGSPECLIVNNSIIAKCGSDGIQYSGFGYLAVHGCTIDGNAGNGINSSGASFLSAFNNIISNHTGSGKFGIVNAAAFPLQQTFADYNTYYNNTADISGGTYGPHDTHGGANPYVGQPTENYTLA